MYTEIKNKIDLNPSVENIVSIFSKNDFKNITSIYPQIIKNELDKNNKRNIMSAYEQLCCKHFGQDYTKRDLGKSSASDDLFKTKEKTYEILYNHLKKLKNDKEKEDKIKKSILYKLIVLIDNSTIRNINSMLFLSCILVLTFQLKSIFIFIINLFRNNKTI